MKHRKKVRIHNNNTKSYFTESGTLPDYKNYEVLSQFITERGKILPRSRTGLTQKEQRSLTIAIKRARHLARLPFVSMLG